jgi:hypothetical protein
VAKADELETYTKKGEATIRVRGSYDVLSASSSMQVPIGYQQLEIEHVASSLHIEVTQRMQGLENMLDLVNIGVS